MEKAETVGKTCTCTCSVLCNIATTSRTRRRVLRSGYYFSEVAIRCVATPSSRVLGVPTPLILLLTIHGHVALILLLWGVPALPEEYRESETDRIICVWLHIDGAARGGNYNNSSRIVQGGSVFGVVMIFGVRNNNSSCSPRETNCCRPGVIFSVVRDICSLVVVVVVIPSNTIVER